MALINVVLYALGVQICLSEVIINVSHEFAHKNREHRKPILNSYQCQFSVPGKNQIIRVTGFRVPDFGCHNI